MNGSAEPRGTRRQEEDRHDRSGAAGRENYEARDGRKRKNYDSHDYDSPKRPRAHSNSPDRSEDRRYHENNRRDPPTGPKGRTNGQPGRNPPTGPRGHANGTSGRDRNSDKHSRGQGPQRGYAAGSQDETERVQYGKQKSKPDNPLTRVSAAWIPDIDIPEEDDLLLEVQKVMGFAGFKSTQNRQVPGNDRNHSVKKDKETQYRQYMNRVGGFNRPLSPSHE